jgi:putative hydrolase of the HAD superfamily
MASPPLQHPRVIFLDALGTLVSLEDPTPALARLLTERHGLSAAEPDVRRAMHAEMRHYRNECGRAADTSSLAALRLECAQLVLDELGVTPGAPSAEQLVPTLLAALRFDVYADVKPALKDWRARGIVLFVVSNWDVSLHDVLRENGLDRSLDGVITSAEAGCAKPDPRIFAAALARAGCAAHEALHIGDGLEEDIAGAQAAGIEAVLLCRGERTAVPDGVRTIASLLEL